jgi:3-hydroxyisobutyrate dehydrogenase
MMSIGYIGLGNMGGAIASRLVGKLPLSVFDSNAEILQAWQRDGVTIATNLPELARTSEIIFTCLPTSQIVNDVILGEGGIARHLAPGSIIVDMTSGDPGVTRGIANELGQYDVEIIDAPVSGGPRGAREGNLAIIVGGTEAQFKRVKKTLGLISKNAVHAGPIGSGHSIKLGNNLLNLICRMATYEVVSMLVHEGVDPAQAVDIIQKSSGRNYATEVTLPDNILSGKMFQGFSTSLMAKDSNLALTLSARHDLDMALGKAAKLILERTIAEHGADADMSAVAKLYETETGARIRP